MLDLGPIGIGLSLTQDGGHLSQAAELERLGYSTLWLAGGQLQSLDPVVELLRATQAARIGTAIIPLDLHDDVTVAATYADVEASDPGRLVVGLGAPQQGDSPMSAMRAFLDRIEAATVPVPQGRRILAALGPRKLALARERFGGAIALLVTPGYTADARRALGADRILVIDQMVVLETDAERARTTAREPLGFLLNVPGYRANTRRMGFSDAEIDALGDRVVDALVAWGDADTIAARVAEHRQAGADHVSVNLLGVGEDAGFIEGARELADRLIR